MEALRTVEYAVRFAAAWSAGWLVPAVPLVAWLGVEIYRRQSRAIARGHAWGLIGLRVVILISVVVLAFRPSLIRRETSTYPGRLLLILDDSASMGVADPALPEGEALKIARQAPGNVAGREAPAAGLREEILAVERTLIRFEQVSRSLDRSLDAFWREAERVQMQVNERLEAVAQRAADLANSAGAAPRLQEISGRCRELNASLKPLFTGDQVPSGESVLKMRAALSELVALLDETQQESDRAAIAAGDSALAAAAGAVRQAPRIDLAYAWLKDHRDALLGAVDGASVWLLPLSQRDPIRFSKLDPHVPAIAAGETDLTGTLLKLLESDNPFPLAGLVIFSDGRNLGDTAMDAVTRAATMRSVPIFSAGVGGAEEPPDIAVCGAYYPPFAVLGKPVGVRVDLKTVLPKPGKVGLELLGPAGPAITNQTLEIAGDPAIQRRLTVTPETEGLQRLTVRVGVAAGEVVPQENNSLDLAVRVRPEPVRVLFLDWKPRWQSRFINNILTRLGYLDINSITVLAQPDQVLKRGVGRGFWPENASALVLYDLIILGDLPSDILTPDEWRLLADYVEGGGSLALLGTGRRDPLPAVIQNLLPTQPRGAETVPPADSEPLQLPRAGRHHPVTRSLAGLLPDAEAAAAERRRDDAVGLLQTRDGRPLISTRFSGKGKTLLIDTDRLWRRLNATALEAHAGLVAGIVDWAVEAGAPAPRGPRPDLYRYTSRESVQIWTDAAGATNLVIELRAGEQMLEAPAVPSHAGAVWAAAVFENVPPGDWTVTRRGGGDAPEPLCVMDRSRELHALSRDEALLRALAANTGGGSAGLADAARLFNDILPRSRVEHQERVWRVWDSPWMLGALVVMLTIEWVWRKLAGLV
ncbi:MAG: hypothetical protein FJ222_02685 [Lentisphaerae bacterium]|nr:hypothetical protein [Lentisphaerota bacterium]